MGCFAIAGIGGFSTGVALAVHFFRFTLKRTIAMINLVIVAAAAARYLVGLN